MTYTDAELIARIRGLHPAPNTYEATVQGCQGEQAIYYVRAKNRKEAHEVAREYAHRIDRASFPQALALGMRSMPRPIHVSRIY